MYSFLLGTYQIIVVFLGQKILRFLLFSLLDADTKALETLKHWKYDQNQPKKKNKIIAIKILRKRQIYAHFEIRQDIYRCCKEDQHIPVIHQAITNAHTKRLQTYP